MRQRNVQLNIRLTEAEMETLERDAAALDRSKSEYVRRCLGFLHRRTSNPKASRSSATLLPERTLE